MFFCGRKKIKIPQHIAIIMDGNARWARSKGLPLQIGHKTGAENLRKISENCLEIGVKFLTVYAFSSENWNRPKDEVNYLMNLLGEYLEKETKPLMEKNIRIVISGNLEKLSVKLKEKINHIQNMTKNNFGLTLNVAFSYGARQEIIDAAKKIALAVSKGEISVDAIDEKFFAANLYQPEIPPKIPDPDLLIRTSGEFRISNFLLWQLAYSELYFTEVYWPDFSKKHLLAAIKNFNQRERRYGAR
ncbi:MAG: di-trans,poly-cis-decaprenylcistransferase [Alphaproteobacteria bacterium RIFCSPLOWO2_01_FULL_40_26]|nr:MAG: di-trans,poly-cis-decaprenylcistransferase [Alphaproteobacteria bacterium RIFCSPHIGHO2_02_FULL_40_34]OFW86862.1 MAG: di-trans,poly-cis-decaprenylcistransferase [Alphaproteobacteria bacterium RIFCSPHIGHO2_01_FULL_40_8]OFW94228.1 MAG: di-trans,poly-cis-decaprenylcistransferase [Alphaproteobacteria bacterium RIFCSPLOWO2_01_FULL_40_26]OFX09797.1 MAG: di-trans,poly-cis-decaprenylcistransferase [Alphaproteobacteria bacterium RIFCSPLOWO2_02_FULL_40_19]OFX12262.1 MAG: di-trans,poly-cis-decapren